MTLGPQKFRFIGYYQIIYDLRLDGSDVLFIGEVIAYNNIIMSGDSIFRTTGSFVGSDCKITVHSLKAKTTRPLIRVGGNVSFAPPLFVLFDLVDAEMPTELLPLLGVYGETEGVEAPRIDVKTEENLCASPEYVRVENNFTLYVEFYDCCTILHHVAIDSHFYSRLHPDRCPFVRSR